jgi:hypothetical protein
MLGGIMGYLAYLMTGSPRAIPIVAALYGVQLVIISIVIASMHPSAAVATPWSIQFDFVDASDAANSWIAVVLLLPVVVASASYLAMLGRTESATARWRILLVGGGLTLWSAAAIVGRIAGAPEAFVIARLAGALLAFAVVLAYAPPTWATRRWGILGVRGELPPKPPNPAERAARREAVGQRVRELV